MASEDKYKPLRVVLGEFAAEHCGEREEVVGQESHRSLFGFLGQRNKEEVPKSTRLWNLEEGDESPLAKGSGMASSQRLTILLDFCHTEPAQGLVVRWGDDGYDLEIVLGAKRPDGTTHPVIVHQVHVDHGEENLRQSLNQVVKDGILKVRDHQFFFEGDRSAYDRLARLYQWKYQEQK